MATSPLGALPGQIQFDDDENDDARASSSSFSTLSTAAAPQHAAFRLLVTEPSSTIASSAPARIHPPPRLPSVPTSPSSASSRPSSSEEGTARSGRTRKSSEPAATAATSGTRQEPLKRQKSDTKKKKRKSIVAAASSDESASSDQLANATDKPTRRKVKTPPPPSTTSDTPLVLPPPDVLPEPHHPGGPQPPARKMDLSIGAIEEEVAQGSTMTQIETMSPITSARSSLSVSTVEAEAVAKIQTTTSTGAPYRRQSMLRQGSQNRALSWRQKNKNAEAVVEEEEETAVNSPRNADENGDTGGDSTERTPTADDMTGDDGAEECDELTFKLPELTKDGEEATGKMVKETWPVDHVMLLYMLSRYAVCARSASESETWIRQIPLLVLMYEGIAAGALNFDYAPAALVIAQEGKPKRIWMNTTQDGKSAIDDLREANLINGLKLSTKDYHSVTAFQVSLRGLQLLSQVSKDLRAKVDAFIFAPKPYRRELLKIRYIPIKDEAPDQSDSPGFITDPNAAGPAWSFHGSDKQLPSSSGASPAKEESGFNEEGRFILESIGYCRYSEVTETEDVSYVSSPFVPRCVRSHDAYQPLSSNAHRAAEAASGQSNIRDTLSEAITLANPVCLVGEWIPFGSNQIVALNERLGSMDRCQGGLFTSLIDDRPTDTQFEVPPGLTQVRILDYDPVRFINFEAEINFPEDDGIVQVENFGIHLNVDGTIFYGIQVDAILDKRSDRISVDLLSRLLVDIHQDSSEVMDDLLSSYQNSLLDMVFLGDIANRGKFNMIMADQIDPFMPGLEYMDRGDYENELKQVLGDIHCAYDLGDDSVMIVGRDGMLVAGSAGKRFEKVFIAYFSLLCREMFLRSFFTRIFVLEELLKHIRQLIFSAKEDPNHLQTIRAKLNQATNDLILFTDTLGYLLESLELVKIPQKSSNGKTSQEEEEIFSYLDLKKQHHDILLRARDLEKLVHGAKYEIVNLRQMAEVLNTSQLEDIFKTVESNTKMLADSAIVGKKSGASLELIQLLLAGSFAFTILDRIPGGSLNIEAPRWVVEVFAKPLIDVPFVFFVVNLTWMVATVAIWQSYKTRKLRREELGRRTLRMKFSKSIHVDHLEAFIATKALVQQESVCQAATEIRTVMWHDVLDSSVRDGLKGSWNQGLKEPKTLKQRIAWWWRRQKKQWFGAKSTKTTKKTLKVPVTGRGGSAGSGGSGGGSGVAGNAVAPGAISPGAVAVPQATTCEYDGLNVQVEVEYDSRHGFLLFVTFHFHRPDDCQPVSQPSLWKRWTTRKPPAPRPILGNAAALHKKKTENATTISVDQSAKSVVGTATPNVPPPPPAAAATTGSVVNPSIVLSKPEQELMTWFAWMLKNHDVITDVDLFLSSSSASTAFVSPLKEKKKLQR